MSVDTFQPQPVSLPRPHIDEGPAWSDLPSRNHNGWTPGARRAFLEYLSEDGNVRLAAQRTGFSHTAAYREKRMNTDFARGWEAALVIARDNVEQLLYDRAIHGVEEQIVYHGEITATRIRHYPRLLLALLGRLDRRAYDDDNRRGAARFARVLNTIGAGKPATALFEVPLPQEDVAYDPFEPEDDWLGPGVECGDEDEGEGYKDEPECEDELECEGEQNSVSGDEPKTVSGELVKPRPAASRTSPPFDGLRANGIFERSDLNTVSGDEPNTVSGEDSKTVSGELVEPRPAKLCEASLTSGRLRPDKLRTNGIFERSDPNTVSGDDPKTVSGEPVEPRPAQLHEICDDLGTGRNGPPADRLSALAAGLQDMEREFGRDE